MPKLLFVLFLLAPCAYADRFAVLCGGGASRDFARNPDPDSALKQASNSLNEQLNALQKKSKVVEVSVPQVSSQLTPQVDEFFKKDMIVSTASLCVTVRLQSE